jgi:hypothetical protein
VSTPADPLHQVSIIGFGLEPLTAECRRLGSGFGADAWCDCVTQATAHGYIGSVFSLPRSSSERAQRSITISWLEKHVHPLLGLLVDFGSSPLLREFPHCLFFF